MANKPITYDAFLFEYKKHEEVAGSGTYTEKVSIFLARHNLITFLGLTAAANLVGATTKQIAGYTRTAEQVGGLELNASGETAGTIAVQGHSRIVSGRVSPRGPNTATVRTTAVDSTSKEKKGKTHFTSRFNFPTGVTVEEIIIALSMLFATNSAILGDSGLLIPKIKVRNGRSYNLITNTTELTALETKYGIKVATSATDAQALEAAAGAAP